MIFCIFDEIELDLFIEMWVRLIYNKGLYRNLCYLDAMLAKWSALCITAERKHLKGIILSWWVGHKCLGQVIYRILNVLTFFQVNQVTHDQAVVLQSALQSIPNPSSECMLRNVSVRLAQQISDEVSIVKSNMCVCVWCHSVTAQNYFYINMQITL